MIKIDAAKIFEKILEEVNNDPKVKLYAEELEQLMGESSLTADDLKKRFTI